MKVGVWDNHTSGPTQQLFSNVCEAAILEIVSGASMSVEEATAFVNQEVANIATGLRRKR